MARERPGKIELPCLSQPKKLEHSKLPEETLNVVQVSNDFILNLQELMDKFKAGKAAECLSEWKNLTSDVEILQIVTGDVIPFLSTPPKNRVVRLCNVSKDTKNKMEVEIQRMLRKSIIVRSSDEPDEFLSPIFPR